MRQPKQKQPDEMKMPAADFDQIMRQALGASAVNSDQKARKKPKSAAKK